MEFSKEKRKATRVNPQSMMIYSAPKVGKTTITVQLENSGIVELEETGVDYVDACVAANIISGSVLQRAAEFDKVLDALIEQQPYEYVIFDTVTRLDEWSEYVGTIRYMQSNQGKNFNRDKNGNPYPSNSPQFKTVIDELGQYGYRWSRDVMSEWFNKMLASAPHVILLAHIKDVYIAAKSGDQVQALDIDLTGKVKTNYSQKVDSLAYFFRKGDEGFLSFKTKDVKFSGSRATHLKGNIKISEKNDDDSITTFWENVFIDV